MVRGWRILVLKDCCMWDEVNCNLFPKTATVYRQTGIPVMEAFLASMKSHKNIKLHIDFKTLVLTSQLVLDISENGNNKCGLSIGNEMRQLINGEVIAFDTSVMHEDAVN